MFWSCVIWKQLRSQSAWRRNLYKWVRHSVELWAGRDRIRSTCFLWITKLTLPASRRVIRFIGVDIIIPTRSSTLPSLYSYNLVRLADFLNGWQAWRELTGPDDARNSCAPGFLDMQISHVLSRGWNWDNRSSIAYYAYLIIQILKFRNVSVTHECICIQLDTPGSFELINNKLFLILMSIFFFYFFQINIT